MDYPSDRRSRLRIVVGPDVTVRFRVQKFEYLNIRITNLSQDGCFATLPRTRNNPFRQGVLLEGFRFEHADLMGEPITAKVAYVLGADGGGRGGMEILGLGIHFHTMTPSSAEMLLQFLEARA